MTRKEVYRAVGLMSGTSLDGIDCALIETDGYDYIKPVDFLSRPYEPDLRDKLRLCLGKTKPDQMVLEAEQEMTHQHVYIVREMLSRHADEADLKTIIGFHGQTVFHDPGNQFTWQIGDDELLAQEVGIDVLGDLRIQDVSNGGQGAPLLPIYHQKIVSDHLDGGPIAILNIGGVANVTWVGSDLEGDMIAFDTGPGNALMDDFILARTGQPYDSAGILAKNGQCDYELVKNWLNNGYFRLNAPKSLDRDMWSNINVSKLSTEDGLATLLAFTLESIIKALEHFPSSPHAWFVCGGGRHNDHLMACLSEKLEGRVQSIEALGYNGDAIEAQGFGYMAVRSLLGLPYTFPGTTGVDASCTGGTLYSVVK